MLESFYRLVGASQPKYSVCDPGDPPPATAAEPPEDVVTLAEEEDEPFAERTVTPRVLQLRVSSVRGPRAT
jgi:hypothetical protein